MHVYWNLNGILHFIGKPSHVHANIYVLKHIYIHANICIYICSLPTNNIYTYICIHLHGTVKILNIGTYMSEQTV